MAEETPVTRCPGLVVQYNPLNLEPGSLVQADNVIIRRKDVIEPRRGGRAAGTVNNTPTQSFVYSNRHLVHNGTNVSYESATGDVYSTYSGSYTAPTDYLMQSEEANRNVYVTTSDGIKVFQDLSGTAARVAGAPRSLDPGPTGSTTGTMVNADVTGFLSDDHQTAYRAVIYRTDLNNNLLIGYPSQRLWLANTTGGVASVTLRLYLPSEARADDVVRFFRATQVSGTTADESGDDLGLIYSATLSSTDISNGYIDFTDRIIDELIGEPIYTSPNQQGLGQANEQPPLSASIAFYKNAFMFYANIETRQRLFLTMVGTSGLTGNTITLAGVTYNFGASEIVSGGGAPQAEVASGGLASQNIDATARSLVRVINRYAGNTGVYAYYTSGPDDLPGKMLIERRTLGQSSFTVHCDDTAISAMFDPPPPTSAPSSGRSVSSNDDLPHMLGFSKFQEPEHVPIFNRLPVGSSSTQILRIVPLRDSLIIIKEDGVFRLVGDNPSSFVVTTLDDTVFCKARNSIAKLANQVFMLSNQGVVSISDTGVEVVSWNIEPLISRLLVLDNLEEHTYGLGYESERTYKLSTVETASDDSPSQVFVYNAFTKAWSKDDQLFTSAIVERSRDKMFFTAPDSQTIFQERKSFTDDDYADPESSVTVTSVTPATKTVAFTAASSLPKVGDALLQGTTVLHIEELSQDPATNIWTAVTDEDVPDSWTTGAATLYPSIVVEGVYNVWHGGSPGTLKQLKEWKLLCDNISGNHTASKVTLTFRSDLDPEVTEREVDSETSGWGDSWGDIPWGGVPNNFKFRVWLPKEQQYGSFWNNGFIHSRALEKVSFDGSSYNWEPISERTNR